MNSRCSDLSLSYICNHHTVYYIAVHMSMLYRDSPVRLVDYDICNYLRYTQAMISKATYCIVSLVYYDKLVFLVHCSCGDFGLSLAVQHDYSYENITAPMCFFVIP